MVEKHHSAADRDRARKRITPGGLTPVEAARQPGVHPVPLREWPTKWGPVTPIEVVEPDDAR